MKKLLIASLLLPLAVSAQEYVKVPTFEFDDVSPFHEGKARIKKNGLYGYLDTTGQIVVSFQFKEAGDYAEGLAPVLREKTGTYIDHDGLDKLVLGTYEYGYNFCDGFAVIRAVVPSPDGPLLGYGVINKEGKKLFGKNLFMLGDNHHGTFMARQEKKTGYLKSDGTEWLELQYDEGLGFNDGLAPVMKGGFWQYINLTGKTVIPGPFDYAEEFSEGVAPVQVKGLWGLLDKSGKYIIQPKYDWIYPCVDGYMAINQGDKWGICNKSGKVTCPVTFQWIKDAGEGLFTAQKDSLWGYITATGQPIIPFKYQEVTAFREGYALVKENGKWGIIRLPKNLHAPKQPVPTKNPPKKQVSEPQKPTGNKTKRTAPKPKPNLGKP